MSPWRSVTGPNSPMVGAVSFEKPGMSDLQSEFEFAHVDRGARPRRLGGGHRAERRGPLLHVLLGGEVLEYHRRSTTLVEEHLQPRGGHPGRRLVGLLDPGEKAFEPFAAYIGESHDAYVHRVSSFIGFDFTAVPADSLTTSATRATGASRPLRKSYGSSAPG